MTAVKAWILGLMLVTPIAIVIVAFVTYKGATPPPNPFADRPRLADTFRFDPKPDITAYELAMAIVVMLGSNDMLPGAKPFYDVLPDNAKRHWKVPEPSAPKATPAVPFPDAPKF